MCFSKISAVCDGKKTNRQSWRIIIRYHVSLFVSLVGHAMSAEG